MPDQIVVERDSDNESNKEYILDSNESSDDDSSDEELSEKNEDDDDSANSA